LAFRNSSDIDVKIIASLLVEMLSQICKQHFFKHRGASFTVFQIKTRAISFQATPTLQFRSTVTPTSSLDFTFFLTG